MMKLDDYLGNEQQNRRILIVSDTNRAQTLIRKYEDKNGKMVRNVVLMTLSQAAKELFFYVQACSEEISEYEVLSDPEASMLFRSTLLDSFSDNDNSVIELEYFNNANLLDRATTDEIFKKINLIRSNSWNEKAITNLMTSGSELKRIKDIKKMIEHYETVLNRNSEENGSGQNSKKKIDTIGIFKKLLEMSKEKGPGWQSEIEGVLGGKVAFLFEEMENISDLEKAFVLMLVNNPDDCRISLFDTQVGGDSEDQKNVIDIDKEKVTFFKGYGSFNEVCYIANDIYEKKLPFGDVMVLYNSPSQLSSICAVLEGNGIPMKAISGKPGLENPCIGLAKSIVDWAEDDFSEKALEKVFSSPVLSVKIEGNKKNLLSGQGYFDHVLNERNRFDNSFSLGWGYERNWELLDHIENNLVREEAEEAVSKAQEESEDKSNDYNNACNDACVGKERDHDEERMEECEGNEYDEEYKDYGDYDDYDDEEYEYDDDEYEYDDDEYEYDDDEYEYEDDHDDLNDQKKNETPVITYVRPDKATLRKQKRAVLELHRDLLRIFGTKNEDENGCTSGKRSYIVYDDKNKISVYKVFSKIYLFIKKYRSRSKDNSKGIRALRDVLKVLRRDERPLSLSECIELIDDTIGSMTIADEENSACVSVKLLNKWQVLDRPIVYVIGLSLKDMQGATIESPVISDELMVKVVKSEFIPTVKKILEIKENDFWRTLKTFNGEAIAFGYSSYDTVNFCENEPSSVFRTLVEKYQAQGINDINEFIYGNPVNNTGTAAVQNINNSVDNTYYSIKTDTSSSALEAFMECPLKYYYDNIRHIPKNEFNEKNYLIWLNPMHRGSFFHRIMKEYVDLYLKDPVKALNDAKVLKPDDIKQRVDELALNIQMEMLNEVPSVSQSIVDKETEDLSSSAVRYIQRLYEDILAGWKVLEGEKWFEKAELRLDFYKAAQIINIKGSIDRIDYRIVDADGIKKVQVRIEDYKTGKKENLQKKYNAGKLIQYEAYRIALMESGKFKDDQGNEVLLKDWLKSEIQRREGLPLLSDSDIVYAGFKYILPMETKDWQLEPIKCNYKNLLSMLFFYYSEFKEFPAIPYFFNWLKDNKTGYEYVYEDDEEDEWCEDEISDDDFELLIALLGNGKGELSEECVKGCTYCAYKELCNQKAVK